MSRFIPSDVPESELRLYRMSDDIATRILEVLHKQGITQDQLAERLGKHKSYVSRVISGGVNLTLRTIAEFESALGIEIIQVPTDEKRRLARTKRRSSAGADTYTDRAEKEKELASALVDALASKQVDRFLWRSVFLTWFENLSGVAGGQTDVEGETASLMFSMEWAETVHWSAAGNASTSPIDDNGPQDQTLRTIYKDHYGTPNPHTD